MVAMNAPAAKSQCEQARYAAFLAAGANLGLCLLAVAFALYVTGVLEPHVAPDRLPMLWGQSAAEFAHSVGLPGGWGWIAHLHRSDIINVAGIGFLAMCSVPGLLAVMPLFAARGERLMQWACALQTGIILLAASGLLAGAH